MKKIFFLFSVMSVILTSCSSDDLPTTDINTETTYPVNFKIATPLIVEGSPTRSTTISRYFNSVEMRVYNEAGDQLMNFYYNNGNINTNAFKDGIANINISLPKGIYHIGFYTRLDTKEITNFYAAVDMQNKVHNFFTYSYPYESTYCYYESITTTVAPTNQTIEQNITLKPLWSNLNLTFNDAQTFNVPEGTDALQFVVSPLYTGFKLETKLATEKAPDNWVSTYSKYKTNTISLDSIRANGVFTYPTYVYQTLSENGNLAIKVNYLKTKDTAEPIILKTRELQIPFVTVENGYNYNISGKLDAGNGDQSMNISLGEFNKEDVVIEF